MWSMVAMVVGAVLDFVLDPLFIFVFGLGICGAALATIICELLSFVMVLVAMQKTGVTRYSLRSVRLDLDLLRENNNGGLPSLARQLVSGVASMAVNHAALPYGDAAVAAMAITVRVASVGNFMQVGIGQGFQPLCGYNYGARRFDRVREGYWFSIRTCSLVVAVISFFTFVFAPQIATLMRNDPDVIAIATVALRFQSVTLPLTSVAMITNFMLQTTGRMWRALFLGLCRLGIVLAPTVTILAQLFGLFGIEIAQSVTDLITVAIAIPLSRSALRELH
jgi:Na+-driven multidrug efflux pump